jgi:alanyl-tRNA synthetase
VSESLARIAQLIRVGEPELVEHVEKLLAHQKTLERQVDQLKGKVAHSLVPELEAQSRTVNGVRILAARVDGMDRAQMRTVVDSLRNKWKSAVIVLAGAEDANVSIVSAVTKDLTSKVQAGKLVSSVAQAVGGKGGGRPDMAEGGGKDASAIPGALERVYQSIEGTL